MAADLRGCNWRDVSADTVRMYGDELCLLTPEAMRSFLPAYMFACAQEYERSGLVADSLIFGLTMPDRTASPERHEQNQVTRFLEWYYDRGS